MNRTFKNLWKFLSVSLVAVLTLAACGGGASGGEKVLNLARSLPTDTLNEVINEGSNNSAVIGNFSEGLTTYDKTGKLIGGLAESWTNEGPVYTFKLRSGLKWSNDTPLTAADFVFGWQTMASTPGAPYGFFMQEIKNGTEILDGKKDASELGVKAIDDTTLEVTLVKESAYILEMLAHGAFYPLNEAFYTEMGADNYGTSAETVIASGAFMLTEYQADLGYTLSKNPNYYNAKEIKLDKVNIRVVRESTTQGTMYDNGEIDALDLTSDLYDKHKDSADLVEIPNASLFYFYLSGNTKKPSAELANQNFRTAVTYAIDKTIITDQIAKNGSIATDYLVPQNFGEVNGKTYREFAGTKDLKFSPEKAQEYLAKAKTEIGKDALTFDISFVESDSNRKIFESVQSQLETNLPGVKVTLTSVPSNNYFKELAKNETTAAFSGWSPDYRDIATFYEIFLSDNSFNYGLYNNPKFDSLFQQAQAETDPAARWELFKQAEDVIVEDAAFVPLFQRGKRFVVNPKVEGFNYNSISPEIDYRFISIK